MENQIPKFLEEILYKNYEKDTVYEILNSYKQTKKVTFRVNKLKTNAEKVKLELDENKIQFTKVSWYEDAFIIENKREEDIRRLEIYKNGEIYLQSLSSMLPAIILNPNPKESILDMAAAPGGKTTQMAALSKNEALITACEKNKIRTERLKYNLNMQGALRVNVLDQDARKLDNFFSFDKILLDAPCTGSGTEDIYNKNFNLDLLNRTKKLQEELLLKAIQILKPRWRASLFYVFNNKR